MTYMKKMFESLFNIGGEHKSSVKKIQVGCRGNAVVKREESDVGQVREELRAMRTKKLY